MKKRTKKSPNEVNQSNSPRPLGSSEGSSSRTKSGLKTFFNKFSSLGKPTSQSTLPLPSASTGNSVGEPLIGRYSISSTGARLITPSQILQWPLLRAVHSKCHLTDQGLIAHRQHYRHRLLLDWKVSDHATPRPLIRLIIVCRSG